MWKSNLTLWKSEFCYIFERANIRSSFKQCLQIKRIFLNKYTRSIDSCNHLLNKMIDVMVYHGKRMYNPDLLVLPLLADLFSCRCLHNCPQSLDITSWPLFHEKSLQLQEVCKFFYMNCRFKYPNNVLKEIKSGLWLGQSTTLLLN